jgi:hypothetical protein
MSVFRREWQGLPAAIIPTSEACPEPFQAALCNRFIWSVVSRSYNLKDRLGRDLRALTPCQYEVAITASNSPIDQLGRCLQRETSSHADWVWCRRG